MSLSLSPTSLCTSQILWKYFSTCIENLAIFEWITLKFARQVTFNKPSYKSKLTLLLITGPTPELEKMLIHDDLNVEYLKRSPKPRTLRYGAISL